jgi:hypothetical protein
MYEEIMNAREQKFGAVEFEGQKYTLINDADWDQNESTYSQEAVTGTKDENGELIVYTISYPMINEDADEATDCCDWDNPYKVEESGLTMDETGFVF